MIEATPFIVGGTAWRWEQGVAPVFGLQQRQSPAQENRGQLNVKAAFELEEDRGDFLVIKI
jgi:hypothetical protein